ncbi:DgyrCDS2385 [Dimorphilus gyrociliatus]|nr:DgyrCDS2385 [Dimorphilus gyrociliatus]
MENRKGFLQGHKNTQLTDVGRKQAESVGSYLDTTAFHEAYSSDLTRAFETCQLILEKSKSESKDLQIEKNTALRERHFGDWEGMHRSVFAEMAGRRSFEHFIPPGGESLEDVGERAINWFDGLCNSVFDLNKKETDPPTRNVLLVSHGGWICAFLRKLVSERNCGLPDDIPLKKSSLGICPNAGLSIMGVTISHTKRVKTKVHTLHKTTYTAEDILEKINAEAAE